MLAFIALVGCPVVIKQIVMKFNWIVDNTKVFWLGLSTYFRFFNGIHPSMLLPPLDHVTAENTFDAHSIHQCIAYFCIHHWSISVEYLTLWWLGDHFQLEGATSKEPSIHADTSIRSCRRTGIGFQVHHLWRWICEQTRSWLSPPSTGIHWHEVCRPKEHPITLSDRTPVSVGILRHHSTAPLGQSMYILYQPLTSYISHVKHKLVHIFQ